MVADYASQQIDETALFYFRDASGSIDPDDIHRPRILSNNYPLDLTMDLPASVTPFLFADAFRLHIPINPYSWSGSQLSVQDLTQNGGASYTAQLGTTVVLLGTHNFVLDAQSQMSWSANWDSGTMFRVLFRYFPDGTTITHLDEGEVALFQGCNYQGKATVFAANTPDFSKLTSAAITLGQDRGLHQAWE